jgi:hypothetical protein
MAQNPLGINQGSQAYVNFDQTGTVNTQVVIVDHGTVTTSNPTGTTVQFNDGTVDLLKAGTITKIISIDDINNPITIFPNNSSDFGVQTEDGGHSTGALGNFILAVRVDGGTSLVNTDLDYAPLQVNAVGALRIAGTVDLLKAGTITKLEGGTLGEVTNLAAGTLTRLAQGSINVTAGTVNAGTVDLLKAGTITKLEGGTVQTNILTGTVTSVTETANLAKGTITKLEGGTVQTNILTGTVTRVSTIGTLEVGTISTLPNLPQGSINVTAGTVNTGTINLGTMVGKDANAVAQSGNPLAIAGTDSGGTLRTVKVDSGGLQRIGIDSGTISVLPNLPQGSINVTAGTVNAGTVDLLKAGTITKLEGGTVQTNILTGTVTRVSTIGTLEVGTISALPNLPQGSINVTAGTITAGSIIVTAGTQSVGTINTGTLNTGTINLGTVVGKDANAAAQTGNPIAVGGTDSGGTIRTVLVDSSGAMKVNGVSAGTTIGTINVGTINTGTINTGTINTGTVSVAVGTINHGTIDAGTVRTDARTTQNIVSFGTQVGSSGALAATIVGSTSVGAGTSLWVNDLSILNPNGSILVTLGFGTAQQGTNVLYRGVLGTQTAVGIEKPFPKAVNAGMTNQDLVLSIGAAGTIDLTVSYLISI